MSTVAWSELHKVVGFACLMLMAVFGTALPIKSARSQEVILSGIKVDAANTSSFATPIAFFNGAVYLATVEQPMGQDNGVNHRTVVRKGQRDANGKWTWVATEIEARTIFDPYHTQTSIAVDKKGYVHVVYNMHNMPWQYMVSAVPEDISRFEFRGEPVKDEEIRGIKFKNESHFHVLGKAKIPGTQVTYPAFFQDNSGDLYLTYRFATRPKRGWKDRGFAGAIAKYDVDSRTWVPVGGSLQLEDKDADFTDRSQPQVSRPFAFEDGWSVYLLTLAFDAQNNMHVTWTWREGGAGPNTTHPSYAFSPDGGKTFYRHDRVAYTLPISLREAEDIWRAPRTPEFYPEKSIVIDTAGEPSIVLSPIGAHRVEIRLGADGWHLPEETPYAGLRMVAGGGRTWLFATGPKVFFRDTNHKVWTKVLIQEGLCDPRPVYAAQDKAFYVLGKACNGDTLQVVRIPDRVSG